MFEGELVVNVEKFFGYGYFVYQFLGLYKSQETVQCQAVVNTVMNILFTLKCGITGLVPQMLPHQRGIFLIEFLLK